MVKRIILLNFILINILISASAQIGGGNNCLALNARLIASNPNGCFYNLVVSNNSNTNTVSLELKVTSGTQIAQSVTNIRGIIQSVSQFPANSITYKKGNRLALPVGNATYAEVCFSPTSNSIIEFIWRNKSGVVLCRQTQTISCRVSPPSNCCTIGLHFVVSNDYKISKIKVTAINGSIIKNADPDLWRQNLAAPSFVEWMPSNSQYVPIGQVIDNDFTLYLSNNINIQALRVDWYQGTAIIAQHTIKISCNGVFQENEDWTKYTTTNIQKDGLFVFASKEDDTDCGLDWGAPEENERMTQCPVFSYNIQCESNQYKVNLIGNSGFTKYTWEVNQPVISSPLPDRETSFKTTTGGSYIVRLTSINSNTNPIDTCIVSDAIEVPKIEPSIKWEQLNCGKTIKFIADGFDNIANIAPTNGFSWSCSPTVSGFPLTGETFNYTFTNDGSYAVTLTIKDKYGCTHAVTEQIKVSSECTPGSFYTYSWCKDTCTGDMIPITVNFSNRSFGGVCPIKYSWDFGDGQTSNDENPSHEYKVPCPAGYTYPVKLTMTDSNSPNCVSETLIIVVIRPCIPDFTYVVCPDGKVTFNATDFGKGEWDFPGSSSVAPFPYSGFPSITDIPQFPYIKRIFDKKVVRYDQSGLYQVTFNRYCKNGNVCAVTKEISVTLDCCAKNDFTYDHYKFSLNNKDYRMKSWFANIQLPLYHRIRGSTKLQVHKSLSLGIEFWKRTKADEIAASFSGKIYRRDSPSLLGCNCKIEDSADEENKKTNSYKTSFNKPMSGRFRSKQNSLISEHWLKIDNYTTPIQTLKLGKDCDPFRWWSDWY